MRNIVFLCIGTSKIIGDSIGPKVGDKLKAMNIQAYVYGNSMRQITAINIEDYMAMVEKRHSGDKIIAIDSALGKAEDIGKIKVSDNGIRPGGAFDKDRTRVGQVGILAVVGDADKDRLVQLRNADKKFVEKLVERVVDFVVGYVKCEAI